MKALLSCMNKRALRESLALCSSAMWGLNKKVLPRRATCQSPEPGLPRTVCRALRNKFLLFMNDVVCSILLEQHRWTTILPWTETWAVLSVHIDEIGSSLLVTYAPLKGGGHCTPCRATQWLPLGIDWANRTVAGGLCSDPCSHGRMWLVCLDNLRLSVRWILVRQDLVEVQLVEWIVPGS
jgi:hypothetical protein